jgi:riboflavin kinase/FMN adenylyltransferase
MLVLRHLERIGRRFASPVVTLGNFDGVHCGHQAILGRTVAAARESHGTAVAITFWPHPAQVLAPARVTPLIMGLRQRLEAMAVCGVDVVIAQRFSLRFAEITARDFVHRLIKDRLRAQRLVVGHSVSFGHRREGNAELLKRLGAEIGLAVEVVEPVRVGDLIASSSSVRRALAVGDLDQAGRLLGRRHSVTGRVVHGHHRGRTIGFPTANLRVRVAMLPPDGVYAVRLRWRERWHPGVANIGFNPTFGNSERSVEAHLFDFEDDLYRQRVEIAFVLRLRGETRFATAEALKAQIEKDVAAARAALQQE